MKKQLINKFIIIIFCICVLALIALWENKRDKVTHQDNIKQDTVLVVADSFETKTIKETDEYSVIDVSYPYFKNIDPVFSLRFENLLKEQIKEHKELSKENWKARFDTKFEGENISEFPTEDEKFEFSSSFKIIQSNDYFISCIITYGGFVGGAHGFQDLASFAFDVKNNKEIKLADLFKNTPNYLEYISKMSRESLTKTLINANEDIDKDSIAEYNKSILDMINKGTELQEDNFSVFTFTDKNIKIYFKQYQVGPYAIGMPEIILDR